MRLVYLFALMSPALIVGGPLFPKTCKSVEAVPWSANAPQWTQWNGWSPDLANTRFQETQVAGIQPADVPKLQLKWAFNLGNVTLARSQPTVVAARLFVTTQTGAVYALDVRTGCTRWGFQARTAVRSGVAFGDAHGAPAIFFGDARANMYTVNAETGRLIWMMRPEEPPEALATAAPRYYKGVVYQPFSSYEELLAAGPNYHCCTFRGNVVALDAGTGKTIWQTFTIPQAATSNASQDPGPSGAAVWSSPTIDEKLGALYVATGNNYSDPPTNTSDSVLAMDLKTGKLLWSKQLRTGDVFNDGCSTPQRTNCPGSHGPDYDFGQPPILVSLAGGKRALVIAQKSGMAYALDPDGKGNLLWQTRAGEGGPFGGSQWGSAADGKNMYVALSGMTVIPVRDPKAPRGFRLALDAGKGGGLVALDLKTGKIVWSAKSVPCAASRTDCSPAQSAAVTAIPGVVFSGSVDGHLRAYSSATGKVIWDTDTARDFDTVNAGRARGGSIDAAGPTVAQGMVFVNSGYGQWGGMPGNVLLAFSVNGR